MTHELQNPSPNPNLIPAPTPPLPLTPDPNPNLLQVMARELRDWGPSQCGQFASVAGLASMTGTLLTLHPSPRYTPLPCHPPFIRHAAHGTATEAARATHSRARLHRRLRLGQPRARACHYRHPRLWRHRARHVRRGTCLASAATPARTQAATPRTQAATPRTQAATSTPLHSLTAATYPVYPVCALYAL